MKQLEGCGERLRQNIKDKPYERAVILPAEKTNTYRDKLAVKEVIALRAGWRRPRYHFTHDT